MGEDRISLLPDCLLVEILSRLGCTRDATKTCVLSKRWKHLWTLLPDLIFNGNIKYRNYVVLSLLHKTLTRCITGQANLNKFQLVTCYEQRFEPLVNDCIRYAVKRNVQELRLTTWDPDYIDKFELRSEFFFTNDCFTSLELSYLILNPVGAINWNNLRSLYISHVNLDEDLIQNILTGSPHMETLILKDCCGFRMFDITSKSVKKFVLKGYRVRRFKPEEFAHIIKIKAPYISSLTIGDYLRLSKLVLLNVSSLVKANLDYKMMGYSLPYDQEAEEEMFKGFIQSLRHVKELDVGKLCSEVLYRLEAKGFTFPSNLKIADVIAHESGDLDGDSEEVLLDDGPESEGAEADSQRFELTFISKFKTWCISKLRYIWF